VLIVEDLVKRYGKRPVLAGVSFRVVSGEVAALVGENGAGKSTLIKAAVGLTSIEGGPIAIGPDGAGPGSMAARKLTAYVPEKPLLYHDLTAWEHLQYVAMVYGMERAEFRRRAEGLLRRLRLWDARDLDPLYMSKGMQQKLSLCAALLVSPGLLLLDEPFSGLDPLAVRQLCAEIAAARSEGAAVLMSTHRLEAAEPLCDRFLLLYEGRLMGAGTGDELRRKAGLPGGAPMDEVFARLCLEQEAP